jgi:predicted Zn-dependent protease
MLRVIRTLKNQEQHESAQARAEGREPRVYHGLFSTHPDNDRRLQEVVEAARSLATAAPRPSGQDIAFLRSLDGLVFGDSEAQGIVRGNHFYHGPLGIALDLPPKWRVINQSRQLVLVAPAEDAVIVLQAVEHEPKKPLLEVLRDRFKGRQLRHTFTIEDGGRSGLGATLRLDTPFGQRDARVVLMRIGGHTFQLVAAVDPSPWPAAYARAIGNTLRGLYPLTPVQKALARPRQLRVVRATPGTTIAQLGGRVPDIPAIEAQLRLLNHLYPRGEPRPGQWLKVID